MKIFLVKSIKITNTLCIRCSFWRFLPFYACFTITVIHVIYFYYVGNICTDITPTNSRAK